MLAKKKRGMQKSPVRGFAIQNADFLLAIKLKVNSVPSDKVDGVRFMLAHCTVTAPSFLDNGFAGSNSLNVVFVSKDEHDTRTRSEFKVSLHDATAGDSVPGWVIDAEPFPNEAEKLLTRFESDIDVDNVSESVSTTRDTGALRYSLSVVLFSASTS